MTKELRLRLMSAVVMIAIMAGVLWVGGWLLTLFIVAAGIVLVSEYWGLVRRITRSESKRFLWALCGACYIGLACFALLSVPPISRLIFILAVIAVDSGAYFAGRAIGGPKIAPSISPSKTWAGLGGGIVGAALVFCGALAVFAFAMPAYGAAYGISAGVVPVRSLFSAFVLAVAVAVLAQSGDFLESWLKRRAGVKDSGSIIPGHGGLLDRVDGLMPVAILAGLLHGSGSL